MNNITLIISIVVMVLSCTKKQKHEVDIAKEDRIASENNNAQYNLKEKYRTALIDVEDSVFLVPKYIDTDINCLKKIPFSEPQSLATQITLTYFSEYSSIFYFTIITKKQIIFETFNESGKLKPNLIFYVESIKKSDYQKILNYFTINKKFEDLLYTHDSAQHLMIQDKVKNTIGKKWEGDEFPLTKIESSWLVERHLRMLNKIGKINIKYKERLLRPVFYNMCNFEDQFNRWTEKYPEIQNHELKY